MKRGLGKIKGFSIQFFPYSEIKGVDSDGRIKKILNVILDNNILILQGKLTSNEEARLIGDTMAMIGHVKNFRGIELAVISSGGRDSFLGKMAKGFANVLAGGDFSSITIIGPASVVKEMKKNPKKIELLLNR